MKKMIGTIVEALNKLYCKLMNNNKTGLGFLMVLVASIIVTVYLQYEFKKTIFDDINKTISTIEDEKIKKHKEGFNNSMNAYYNLKNNLKEHRKKIGCDYILFIEYHNGAENIATGYQFCKFDITIQVKADSASYIQIDDYRDESILKYDIFMHEKILKNRLAFFNIDEIRSFDENFYHQIEKCTDNINTVATSHIYFEGYKAGALLFFFNEKDIHDINIVEVTNCASHIEEILIDEKI